MPDQRLSRAETVDQATVHDILDAMHTPPVTVDREYADRCVRAAGHLRLTSSLLHRVDAGDGRPLLSVGTGTRVAGQAGGSHGLSSVELRNVAFAARASVFDVIDEVASLFTRSDDDPFSSLAEINASRRSLERPDVSPDRASSLVRDIHAALDAVAERRAADAPSEDAAATQLSSARISFQGFGGSGDPATDLLRFTPDVEYVRREKTSSAASVFDFTLRVPRIVFTADYSPDGDRLAALIGWRRIPDASGYIVSRRNIFDGREVVYTLTNEKLRDEHAVVREYVDTWVTSFYDDVDVDSIWTFRDPGAGPHAWYTYTVQAFQTRRDLKGSVFSVSTVPVASSPAQRAELKRAMEELDPGDGPDTVSPYPVLAQHLLGDSRYDWVLSGVNIRASVGRNDTRGTTRSYSYLTAQMDFLLDQMRDGKFVVPKDVTQVITNVTDAVTMFGVSQVIDELLRETCILYHFEGTDVKDDMYFDRIGGGSREGIVATVLAAADAETATLDLRSLSTNLPMLLDGTVVTAAGPSGVRSAGRSEEIEVPDAVGTHDGLRDGDFADLTTFEGLSKFVRAIRVFSDASVARAPTTFDHRDGTTPVTPVGGDGQSTGTGGSRLSSSPGGRGRSQN